MKLTASKLNNSRSKEWFNDKMTLYFGRLPKGDVRLGITIGNREGNADLLFFYVGYDLHQYK